MSAQKIDRNERPVKKKNTNEDGPNAIANEP
jgi:hypothetical protein